MDHAPFLPIDHFHPSKFNAILQLVPHNEIFASATDMHRVQKQIINNHNLCPDPIVSELSTHLFQSDGTKINRLLNAGPYDHKIQDGLSCLVDALIFDEPGVPNGKLRAWLSNLQRINSISQEGQVYNVPVDDQPDIFALKTPKSQTLDDLQHEAFIGLLINSLRSKVPNFMHTYGIFKCPSPPSLAKNQYVCGYHGKNVSQLIVENIRHGQPLKNIKINNNSQILNIVLQVINALNVANAAFGFVHYDLHIGNIMVIELPSPISIPIYMPDDTIQYIITRQLVKIIDYGFSRVEINNTIFYRFGYDKYNITGLNFPAFDIQRFILTWYALLSKQEFTGREVFSSLYNFFQPSMSVDARIKLYSHHDLFQPDYDQLDKTHDMCIDYIFRHHLRDLVFVNRQPGRSTPLSICTECYSWEDFVTTLFDDTVKPNSIVTYFQGLAKIIGLPDSDHKRELLHFIQSVDVIALYNSELPVIYNIIESSFTFLSKFVLTVGMTPDEYITALTLLATVRDRMTIVRQWIDYAMVLLTDNNLQVCLDAVNQYDHNMIILSNTIMDFDRYFKANKYPVVLHDMYFLAVDRIIS